MTTHQHGHYHEDMLSVEEALERILSYFSVLETEEKPALDALGQTLAEEVDAAFDIPPLDNSAMDGFAVRHADIAGASAEEARSLPVISQVAAGHLPDRVLDPGTAIRIMTGAPIPQGANTVVPFEETDELERKAAGMGLDQIAIRREVGLGANVRPAGEDVSAGELVLRRGAVLGPAQIGVLASQPPE